MDFKKTLDINSPEEGLTAELEYCNGFFLTIAYWSEMRLEKELKASKRTKFTKHQKVQEVSTEAFRERLTDAVQDWRGMTYRTLAEMGLVDLRKVVANEGPEVLDQEQPFSREDLLILMKVKPSFEGWLGEMVTEPGNFPLQEEQKNSCSSSGGGTTPDESPAKSAPSLEQS
ncbi:MAG: hypothetical protein K9K34_07815 [Desulfarculaceae bacterium]|nr:hypothetical protein [Desulfarculaceae bacterium]